MAIVLEVDGDGDFRLRNPRGQESSFCLAKKFRYATHFQAVTDFCLKHSSSGVIGAKSVHFEDMHFHGALSEGDGEDRSPLKKMPLQTSGIVLSTPSEPPPSRFGAGRDDADDWKSADELTWTAACVEAPVCPKRIGFCPWSGAHPRQESEGLRDSTPDYTCADSPDFHENLSRHEQLACTCAS
jgi:hypothetical protein